MRVLVPAVPVWLLGLVLALACSDGAWPGGRWFCSIRL